MWALIRRLSLPQLAHEHICGMAIKSLCELLHFTFNWNVVRKARGATGMRHHPPLLLYWFLKHPPFYLLYSISCSCPMDRNAVTTNQSILKTVFRPSAKPAESAAPELHCRSLQIHPLFWATINKMLHLGLRNHLSARGGVEECKVVKKNVATARTRFVVWYYSLFECSLNAVWMQFECRLNAVWMPFECRLNAFWMPFECIFNAVWMQFECRLKRLNTQEVHHNCWNNEKH